MRLVIISTSAWVSSCAAVHRFTQIYLSLHLSDFSDDSMRLLTNHQIAIRALTDSVVLLPTCGRTRNRACADS